MVLAAMSKTLVIAEKPSVGKDLTKVLPGAFTKGEGFLEGPEHVVTWAVGHSCSSPTLTNTTPSSPSADAGPADRPEQVQARGA